MSETPPRQWPDLAIYNQGLTMLIGVLGLKGPDSIKRGGPEAAPIFDNEASSSQEPLQLAHSLIPVASLEDLHK
jgi:hypothetical protein